MQPSIPNWTLESYIQVYQALTKGGDAVKPVSAFEECFYKNSDLKQVLQLHGVSLRGTASRKDVLQALEGCSLTCPVHQPNHPTRQTQPASQQPDGGPAGPFALRGADLEALGWSKASEQLDAALANPNLLTLPCPKQHTPADGQAGHSGPASQQLSPATGQPGGVGQAAAPQGSGSAHQGISGQQGPASGQQQLTAPAPASTLDPVLSSATPQQHQQPAAAWPQAPLGNQAQQQPAHGGQGWHVVSRGQAQSSSTAQISAEQHRQQAAAGAGAPGSAAGVRPLGPARPPAAADLPPAPQAAAVTGLLPTGTMNQPQQLLQQQLPPQAPPMLQPGHNTSMPMGAALPLQGQGCPGSWGHPGSLLHRQAPMPAAAGATEAALQEDTTEGDEEEQEEEEVDAGAAAVADAGLQPDDPHTRWLRQQLQALREAGAAADPGDTPTAPGGLKGRRVAFALLEELSIQSGRGQLLTLPAGLYQGRAVRFMGSACRPELCEEDCCQQPHQFYQAKVIPPDRPSAAAGRPVQLCLDLAPRLRCRALEELLGLQPEQLQDAWVLLAARTSEEEGEQQQQEQVAAVAADDGSRQEGCSQRSSRPPAKKAKKAR